MTTTTAPHDLVRGLRYRRWLGRQQLVRGVTPSRPRMKYGLAPGCLGAVLFIVAIYVIALVALAIQMALYVVVALAALLIVRPFSQRITKVFGKKRKVSLTAGGRKCGQTSL